MAVVVAVGAAIATSLMFPFGEGLPTQGDWKVVVRRWPGPPGGSLAHAPARLPSAMPLNQKHMV